MSDQTAPRKDGSVAVTISPDGMEAAVILSSPQHGGEPVPLSQILKALSAAGVREGIDRAALESALERGLWGREIVAARGTPGQPSQAGQVQFCFPLPEERLKPLEAQDGKVDFRNLNLIHNVKRGDVLALRTPAVQGRPGLTVTGKVIQPQIVADPQLAGGQNTQVDGSGCKLLATADGHVTVVDRRVVVLSIYLVQGDVDFSVGNIDFVGNVLVTGDIKTGFMVKAGGDIEVRGLIEAAEVSAGGNILVRNGIIGSGRCQIVAKGNILARYVEEARLEAGNNVIVQDGIIRSQVRANSRIKVEGRRSEIIGGRLQALEEITARVIGSEMAIPTVLELGVAPKLREEYAALQSQYRDKKNALLSLERFIREYQEALAKGREISDGWKRTVAQRLVEYDRLNKELEELQTSVDRLEFELQRLQLGQVRAYDCVHPGVSITIGRATQHVQSRLSRSTFILDKGQIAVRALR